MMLFKRKPRDYQLEDFNRFKDEKAFGIFYEMGLGKSKITNDNAIYLYSKGRINGYVIIAPNGIHSKWQKEDFPNDIPDNMDYKVAVWKNGNKKSLEECEQLLNPGSHLRILCMNIEALSRKKSLAEQFLIKFLNSTDSLLVIDESDTIKNPIAKCTEIISKLGDKAVYKRILTGTPINNNIFDLYSQFNFLNTDIFMQSFTAFKHTYAEIMPANHPTMIAIMRKNPRFAPTLPEKDKDGRIVCKNIDKLQAIISQYSIVRKKADCLNLPDKTYESIYYELESKQRKLYDELKTKLKVTLNDDTVSVLNKLTLMIRLQQLLSGFLPTDTTEGLTSLFKDVKDNPRIKALETVLETVNGQVIIWCRFVEEIKQIKELLGEDAITFYGETKDRDVQMDLFKSGKKNYMIANARVGGVGLNLTNSHTMIYYSNDFSYRNRAQSEDRQHRIGQTEMVTCIDLIAESTIDEHIIRVLRNKKDVSVQTMSF